MSEWTDITAQLPDDGIVVLTYDDIGEGYAVVCADGDDWRDPEYGDLWTATTPSHWKPLDEPPKGDE